MTGRSRLSFLSIQSKWLIRPLQAIPGLAGLLVGLLRGDNAGKNRSGFMSIAPAADCCTALGAERGVQII